MTDMQTRVTELEELVSAIRHDVRGALVPIRLMIDRMHANPDPQLQEFAATIDRAMQRILDRLGETPAEATSPYSKSGD